MRLASVSLALCLAVSLALGAPARKGTPKADRTSAKAPAKNRTGAKGKVVRLPGQTWRNRQMAPTKQRYLEIQQALYEQGYLEAEPSGVWDKESIAALRGFQTDQKLSVTGRISALTLINLGLGPSHPLATLPLPVAQQ